MQVNITVSTHNDPNLGHEGYAAVVIIQQGFLPHAANNAFFIPEDHLTIDGGSPTATTEETREALAERLANSIKQPGQSQTG